MKAIIVITGGPASGKTTLISKLKQYYKIEIIPEVYSISLPWIKEMSVLERQSYIYRKHIELLEKSHYEDVDYIVCDRGSIDGMGYVSKDLFMNIIDGPLENEYYRYDFVLYMETVAKLTGYNYVSLQNSRRNESQEIALNISNKLYTAWSIHNNFHSIRATQSFSKKISSAIELIKNYA